MERNNNEQFDEMRKEIRKEYEYFAICVIILGLIMMTILISTSIEPSNYWVLILLTIIIFTLSGMSVVYEVKE